MSKLTIAVTQKIKEIIEPKIIWHVGMLNWPENWGEKPAIESGLDYHYIQLAGVEEKLPITEEVIKAYKEITGPGKRKRIRKSLPNPRQNLADLKILLKVAYQVKKNLI